MADIARRLEAFDMEVSYHARSAKAEFLWTFYPSVLELAKNVDCLIVAAPGGSETYHIIGDQVLSALVKALKSGTIAGAALDVFEEEPSIPSALRDLSNVIVTPHVAAFAPEVHAVSTKLLLDNIEGFLRCGAVVSPVPEMRDALALTS